MRRLRLIAAIAALIVVLTGSLSAQRVTRRVYVAASDAKGAPVLDLTAADLTVTENGTPREVTRATLGTAPLRVVLLVDSSTTVGPMMNSFRAALTAFVDALPDDHEIAFISTGGQIRVRTQPSTDRLKLKAEIARFASDGGANAFLDTLIEADKRFLKSAPNQWPTLVILTSDNGETRREMPIGDYNKFMNDYLTRGGAAHAVVVRGKSIGPVTDITQNLIENTGGLYDAINTEITLPERAKAIAVRLAGDYEQMENRYVVEFTSDAKVAMPVVNVAVTREGVRLDMSVRRPF